jgi:hypothetical protein
MNFKRIAAAVGVGALLALTLTGGATAGAIRDLTPTTSGPTLPEGGVGSNTNLVGSDTLRTYALKVLGAHEVVYSIKATTGIDSAIVVQVSQDSTHWFAVNLGTTGGGGGTSGAGVGTITANSNQDAAAYQSIDGVSADSLRNGPKTLVVYGCDMGTAGAMVAVPAGASPTLLPMPHRYMRLKIYGKVGKTITGLAISAMVFMPPGVDARIYDPYYSISP